MPRRIVRYAVAALNLSAAACTEDPELAVGAEFNPPSNHTIAHQRALRQSLPFEDQRDFDEHRRGFIAAPDLRRITDESGKLVWDIGQYDFLLTGEDLDSIHPSLQRQATLNMNFGLYEVVPDKIYQVRGFDLSNMTLVRARLAGSCSTCCWSRKLQQPLWNLLTLSSGTDRSSP